MLNLDFISPPMNVVIILLHSVLSGEFPWRILSFYSTKENFYAPTQEHLKFETDFLRNDKSQSVEKKNRCFVRCYIIPQRFVGNSKIIVSFKMSKIYISFYLKSLTFVYLIVTVGERGYGRHVEQYGLIELSTD